mgnify:CR=1 FL=1
MVRKNGERGMDDYDLFGLLVMEEGMERARSAVVEAR